MPSIKIQWNNPGDGWGIWRIDETEQFFTSQLPKIDACPDELTNEFKSALLLTNWLGLVVDVACCVTTGLADLVITVVLDKEAPTDTDDLAEALRVCVNVIPDGLADAVLSVDWLDDCDALLV